MATALLAFWFGTHDPSIQLDRETIGWPHPFFGYFPIALWVLSSF
jgi:hypothetical protein